MPAVSARCLARCLSLDAARREVAAIRAGTSKPFNVNFFCHAPPTPSAQRETAWRAALQRYYDELGLDAAGIPAGPGRYPFDADAADLSRSSNRL